jgi:cephalosporin hydroxylase
MYSPMVTKDSYLIVEDTSVNGNPVRPDFGPGPKEAVDEFLNTNADFIQERTREKFGLTFCPGGYLKRIH